MCSPDTETLRTLAAGREEIVLLGDNNIDMQARYQTKGWPTERPEENYWLHSDMRVIAYPYVSRLFDSLVTMTK